MSKPSFSYTPLLLPVRWTRFRARDSVALYAAVLSRPPSNFQLTTPSENTSSNPGHPKNYDHQRPIYVPPRKGV
jgi:hypothetical protein